MKILKRAALFSRFFDDAWFFSSCQMILVKKIVSRIRDSRAGSPYRRKLRYPKFNFILFPLFPIFSILWVSRFCACHSKFDWNQYFTKNFIIWQESHTLQKLHLCVKGLTLHKLPLCQMMKFLVKYWFQLNLLWQAQNCDTQRIGKIGKREKRMMLNFGYRVLRRYGLPARESQIRLTIFLSKVIWRHVNIFSMHAWPWISDWSI